MQEILDFNIENFFQNVRFIDLLDVILISVFLYLLLNWLRRSVSNRSLIGLSTLIAVYIFARITDMYLTELLIQGLFIIILIGTVVVFQSDIRRLMDRLGTWDIFRKQTVSQSNVATDIIAEAASKMAEDRTGALMVIRGKDPWDRHIHGGIELNGEISLSFLLSIFNPKAPGHDGAVLLEDHKITRFGTHLPLSTNLDKKSAGGTRHAAALGMSEHCDALVVVVSEERGVISVAQSGRLFEVGSGSELKNILDEFWSRHYQAQDTSWMDWWKKRHLKTALASVAIAAALWFSFAYQTETVFRTFSVPIEYRNLNSSNVVLQDSVPSEARITLSGSEQAFRSLDPSQLVVSFDMAEQDTSSDELLITQNNLNLPADLNLYEVNPRALELEAREFEEVQIPVKVSTRGILPNQMEIVSLTPSPRQIDVLVDNSSQNIPDSISTEPVDLSAINGTDTLKAKLVVPAGMRIPDRSANRVSVIVEVGRNIQ
ncbi:MAG TPA: diadenylate cyclase [Balneolaceae bacterium]